MKRTLTTATALTAALILSGHADAATITGVTIEDVSSELDGFNGFERFAVNTVNGSGLNFGGTVGAHDNLPDGVSGPSNLGDGTMWLSNGTFTSFNEGTDPLPVNPSDPTPFITFDLEGNYDLNSIKVWNYNEGNGNRGANLVEIQVAASAGGAFTSLGDFTFTQATGATNVDFGQTIDLTSFAAADNARLVRFNIKSNHGDGSQFVGLSEVSFDGVPEPGSLALLTLGGLLIARRRRG